MIVLGIVTSRGYAGLWIDPNSFDVNTVEGTVLEETLTIGNDGNSPLNFTLRTREVSREVQGRLSSGKEGYSATVVAVEEDKIVISYKFDKPAVYKDLKYDHIRIEGMEAYRRTGAPIVPVCPVKIMIPFGKKVSGSRVVILDVQQLAGTYLLPPAQEPHPLSYKGTIEQTEPNPAIYGRALPWPGIEHEEVGTQSKRGYRLFVVNLFPVQYIPATGEVSYATGFQLEIDLADAVSADVLRPSESMKAELAETVDNPDVLGTYPRRGTVAEDLAGAALPGGGPYQYVIITSELLEASPGPWNFQALRDAKIAHGISATIVTTEWIYATYDGTRPDGGSDNQTRIRNFLIDAYQTWGTEYVLLGGINGIVPAREFWVEAWPGGDIDTMPVDMYYGCVEPNECTFDYDADGRYGEPNDGVGGGEVDLYAEIYVGRAPVESATELRCFIIKTLTYASTYSEYLSRIAMLGEYLGFGGVSEYAKDSLEQIRLGGDYNGYFTYGFENHLQPDYYDFNTAGCLPDYPSRCWPLYDKDSFWPKSNLIDLMNGGAHVFNHLGHSSYTYGMKLSTSDLASLTNTEYFFVYSQGCKSGGFDTSNCFAEVITTMEYGAFAVVMNARYGYGDYNSTNGPSQYFNRQFWDAVLNEGMLEMGRANQDSKEDNIWGINADCIRWCYYELNLFGDPQQEFHFEEACEWLTTEPREGIIEPDSIIDVNVTFGTLELPPGTDEAEIIIISNDPCSPTIIPVTLTVNPDDLQVAPIDDFKSSGNRGGPFTPACMTYALTNNGPASVSWTTDETEAWVEVEPNEGVLDPCDSIEVNVCITSDANLLDPGTYDQMLTFGNTTSGSIKLRLVTLTVKPPDCFTESFDGSGNGWASLSLTFSPDGSSAYYEACRGKADAFPTDPNGGIYVPLGDDDFAEVILNNDANILYYGSIYDRIYIGSNGYITFGQGDTELLVALGNHFNMPRISALFTDLTPSDNQSISYKQLNDRLAVTFEEVPLYGDETAKNSFQIEMFYADGTIRITWLEIAPAVCVAGLSEGYGLPPLFLESDLSEYVTCRSCSDFNRDYYVDMFDLAIFVSHWLEENCEIPHWCEKTDLDFSGTIEMADFAIFAENWLAVEDWWLQPISHWTFDEGSGITAHDSAGKNDGTLVNGPVWTKGRINGALDFDGADDYVDLGTDTFAKLTQGAISAWVKPSAINACEIVGAKQGTSNDYRMGFRIINGKLQIYLKLYLEVLIGVGGTVLQTDTWHHVVYTTNSFGNAIYVNGIPETVTYECGGPGTNAFFGHLPTGQATSIGITKNYSGADRNPFNGVIDDVRIYDRALSAEEIEQIYQEGLGGIAIAPNPANEAGSVDPNVILSWSPGKDANSHDVYLGTDFNDVNDANTFSSVYIGNFDVNSYDPCGLDPLTAYYWRIDEVNEPNVWKGDIWSFTTSDEDLNFVSWWKFDEGNGTTAYDTIGDNDGVITGAAWFDDPCRGMCLSFDGDGDYVNVGDKSSLEQQEFTLSFLAQLDNPSGSFQGGVVKGNSFGPPSYHSYKLDFHNGSARATVTNTSDYGFTITSTIGNSDWHMWSMTVGDGTLTIYKDGAFVDSTGYTGPIGYDKSYNNFVIGAGDGGSFPIDGKIDDVRFYNRALSAGEIEQLYQDGL